MAVSLIPLFTYTPELKRDMVYCMTVADSVSEGGEVPSGCVAIYKDDRDYVSRLNEYYKRNALVIDLDRDGEIIGKIIWDDTASLISAQKEAFVKRSLIVWGIALFSGMLILVFVYVNYIRPFKHLQKFTGEIAKGNLDFPLKMGRNNFFGAFTESFDIMREELKKAQEGKIRAEHAKQEMMAELSHDIRTPLATINATCEVLEIKSSDPDVTGKVGVIKSKAGTIDSLITNMMSAALEEAEELKVQPCEGTSLQIVTMIDNMRDVAVINVRNEMPECLLFYDPLRLEQVLDNIINNSVKYAGTPIDVEYIKQEKGIVIRISDKGPGVPEDELSVITQKFYRGSGSQGKPGSGLGLFLADYFMHKMEGDIVFYNDDGLTVELFVRKV